VSRDRVRASTITALVVATALIVAGAPLDAHAGDARPKTASSFHWLIGPEVDVAFKPAGATVGYSAGFAAANFIALAHLGIGFDVHNPIVLARAEAGARLWPERYSPFLLAGIEGRDTGTLGDPAIGRDDALLTLEPGMALHLSAKYELWLGARWLKPLASGGTKSVGDVPVVLLVVRFVVPA
jgi:hypothetical protein